MENVKQHDFGIKICQALGLDPTQIRRVIVDVHADGPVVVFVEMYAPDPDVMWQINWTAALSAAEIVAVPSARDGPSTTSA
jgi:hypothetical protein